MARIRDALGLGAGKEPSRPTVQQEIAQGALIFVVPFIFMYGGFALYRFAQG